MMIKTKQEILQGLLDRLVANTPVTNVDPGTIARTFSDILSEEFYEFYSQLDLNATMSFVSTATGTYLDLIGSLLDCTRNNAESDDNYRSRISKQVYVVAGANYTSIRLQVLAIDSVRDVVMKQYTNGAGSFTIHVITDTPETPVSVLNQVQSIVDNAKAYGVYAEVKSPVLIPIQLKVRLIFDSSTGDAEKGTIRQAVSNAIQNYVDNLILGDTMVMNEVIQLCMDASAKIQDLDIYSLKVNGASRFVTNIPTKWNERLVIDTLDII